MNKNVPVRLWFDDPDEEEHWGYGYRDDMITQFKQGLYNKHFTLQDQGKDDPIDTLENRIKFWINVIENCDGSMPDNVFDYDYNNEGLDWTVRGWECKEFPERRDSKKIIRYTQ